MTEQESKTTQSNVEKLYDFINQQDRQGRAAMLLLLAAAAILNEEDKV